MELCRLYLGESIGHFAVHKLGISEVVAALIKHRSVHQRNAERVNEHLQVAKREEPAEKNKNENK